MTKPRKATAPKLNKEKVTVSIDAELLSLVDSFVRGADGAESRSSVFERSLRLWKRQARKERADAYYKENAAALNDPEWRAVTTESAGRIFEIEA